MPHRGKGHADEAGFGGHQRVGAGRAVMVGLLYRHGRKAGLFRLGDGQFHGLRRRYVAERMVGIDEGGDRRFAQHADIGSDVDQPGGELLRVKLHHRRAVRIDAADVGGAHALGAGAGVLGAHAPGGENGHELGFEGVEGDAHGGFFL